MTNLADLLLDVQEAHVLELLRVLVRVVEGLAELAGALADGGHPELGVLGQLVRAVVGEELAGAGGLQLEPAAGGQVVVGLLEELLVVGDAAAEFTGVDVVEGPAVGPFRFEVVDLEDAVGRGPVLVSMTGQGSSLKTRAESVAYHLGWIGLKSVP